MIEQEPSNLPHDSQPTVVALYTAFEAGAPMRQHTQVRLIAGIGIAGDRYANGRGHWSDPRWPDQQITLVAFETADALTIDARHLRRNIVTRGVNLNELIGRTFTIGDAILVGVRRCDPCRYLESLTRTGIARELADRGGLRAHIVEGATIHLGDGIRVLSGNSPG